MRSRTIAIALAAAVLAGCAAAPPSPRRTPPPDPRSQSYNCPASGECLVTIQIACSANICSAFADRDPIHLVTGSHNVPIRWLLPNTYGFCSNQGDGVFLETFDGDDQFENQGPSGEGGGPGNRCKRSYKWVGKHTVSKPSDPYPYQIKFHDAAGNPWVIDPYVYND